MSKTDNVNGYEDKKTINWYPGHMAKTKRELKENINLIDVVYEVIDARMPVSSKIIDIEDIIKNKSRILVVTKYDLCDKEVTDKILDTYRESGYTVITCDLLRNVNVKKIVEKTRELAVPLNKERAKKGLKPRKVRALVIGVPNVGKSTLINQLVGRKAVNVGNTPGVTKSIGWIRINNDIELLDSPGILWPKIENQEHAHNLAALSSIKEEILDREELCRYIINKLNELYPSLLMKRYNLESIDIDTIFDDIGKKRGIFSKGGIVDYDKVYSVIIKDLKDGNFGGVTFDRI